MVLFARPLGPEYVVGDRVIYIRKKSRYTGLHGVIVQGDNGTCYTPSFQSCYVLFDVDAGDAIELLKNARPSHNRVRTLRCESLGVVSRTSLPLDVRRSPPLVELSPPEGYGRPTNHDLLRDLCAALDALALQGDLEADGMIRAFAEDVLRS